MYLAQINIAQLVAPQGDPRVADFFTQVTEVNALAEQSEGFIWRFDDDYPDPSIAFNMSVWESIEALRNFVYRSAHVLVLRRKDEWFTPMQSSHMALWWVDQQHQPTPEQGYQKLALLDKNGPTVDAFTFAKPFTAPSL